MTYEEAIKRFEPIVDHEAYTDSFRDACKMAIEALEKQIPKKVIVATGVDHTGKTFPIESCCPNCLADVVSTDSYCADCGQRLE